jgi:xanthine dehydrogenase accessory factor
MDALNSDIEVLSQAIEWLDEGSRVELITVARTWGSSPRPPGSLAAVREDGHLVGSVSGGCIEKQLAVRIDGDDRAQIFAHTISTDEARKFGLPCGGHLELVFEALQDSTELKHVLDLVNKRHRVARTIALENHSTNVESVGRDVDFHFDDKTLRKVFGPGWRMLLIGGGQLSRFVATFAQALDYEIIVCEPREEYASSWSVSGCELTSQLPEEAVLSYATDPQSIVLALTHDPNLDDSALIEALPSDAFYVGALGSKGNNDRRRKRLVGIGLEEHEVNRLHGPVGLNIGSRSAAEIAIAIMGEIIQERNATDLKRRAEASQPASSAAS